MISVAQTGLGNSGEVDLSSIAAGVHLLICHERGCYDLVLVDFASR